MVDFYQHNISDWENGTKEMPFELEAFYRKLCDQIYSFTDELPDDDHLVSRLTKLSMRKYRTLKNTLVDMGKININNGLIRNARCTDEVTKILALSDLMREKQAKSVSKRRLNKENKTAKDGKLSNINNKTPVAGAIAGALANSGTSEVPLLRNGADAQISDPKKELFDRAIVIFNCDAKRARSLCGKLLKAKGDNIALARAAIETASTMADPHRLHRSSRKRQARQIPKNRHRLQRPDQRRRVVLEHSPRPLHRIPSRQPRTIQKGKGRNRNTRRMERMTNDRTTSPVHLSQRRATRRRVHQGTRRRNMGRYRQSLSDRILRATI